MNVINFFELTSVLYNETEIEPFDCRFQNDAHVVVFEAYCECHRGRGLLERSQIRYFKAIDNVSG